jgi:uncharacterized membrane protein HdeD (DUF308 family)
MLAIPEKRVTEDELVNALSVAEPGPFQDIPKQVWIVFLSAWTVLFGMFVIFFTVNASASFVVTIAALFAVMAFGLPAALAAQGRREGHRCGKIVQTHTGPLSITAAGAQIAAVPICAIIGLTAFIAIAR